MSRAEALRKSKRVFLVLSTTAILTPSLAALAITLRTLFRRGRPYAFSRSSPEQKPVYWEGLKTMADVMSEIKKIPTARRFPTSIGQIISLVLHAVPGTLNLWSKTSGVLYPFPGDFKPIVIASKDETPVCGMLALHADLPPGPALLLAHGLFSSKNSHKIVRLATTAFYEWGFHVLAIDLRNFGDSARLSSAATSWGFRESDDIISAGDFLRSLDRVTSVGLLGINMGASASLLAAANSGIDGPFTGGVVAIGPYSDAKRAIENLSISISISRPLKSFAISLAYSALIFIKTLINGPRPVASLREYTRQISAQYYELSDEEIYRLSSPGRKIASVEIPCLVIHALDDPVIPVSEAQELYETAHDNPMIGLVIAPFGGHASFLYSSPRWFLQTIRTFFTYWTEGVNDGYSAPGNTGSLGMLENPDN